MTATRVVLDTNVLVSAVIFSRGGLCWIRAAWTSGRVIPLVSRETIQEFIDVLAYPRFELTPPERQSLMEEYLPYTEVVDIPVPPPRVSRCRDPDDVKFLRLASAAKADAIVTGDRDLLALADSFLIPILAPATFKIWL